MCADESSRPARPEKGKLADYWDREVADLVFVDALAPTEAARERHGIYMLLLMALVDYYWNPLKRGRRRGEYNAEWVDAGGDRLTDHEYKGHNIAALAVDARGRVIDFDFNHNKLFNSSAEHAEARLVRRIFSLAHIADSLHLDLDHQKRGEYDTFADVTIYTSLESCAQCAGMMALGNVKEVVYLQTDPGMFMIGNILFNLSDEEPTAPRPISAREIDLGDYQETLETGYREFQEAVASEPFWKSHDGCDADHKPSISTFLCTSMAKAVFAAGHERFEQLVADPKNLNDGSFKLTDRHDNDVDGGLTSDEALAWAEHFFKYATTNGRRGTPHGS
jgi:tRNA(Arg) A34 adenosine deaminase TadA